MVNGDNRKTVLHVMAGLVFLIFAGGGYLYYEALLAGEITLAEDLFDFLKTAGILIVGLFVAIGRELFSVGKQDTVILRQSDVDAQVGSNQRGDTN